jgi:diguanylate cyclase (GGDEF)-like protein
MLTNSSPDSSRRGRRTGARRRSSSIDSGAKKIRNAHLGATGCIILLVVLCARTALTNVARHESSLELTGGLSGLAWRAEEVLRYREATGDMPPGRSDNYRRAVDAWNAASDATARRLQERWVPASERRAFATAESSRRRLLDERGLHDTLTAAWVTESYVQSISGLADDLLARARVDDGNAVRGLIGWFGLIVAMLLIEGRLLAQLFLAPIRKTLAMERQASEQQRERRELEARERELRLQNRELERLAGTDALTGLSNRRALITWLRRESERLTKAGKPLGALMIDIDHFKALNDEFGHAMGDDALRLVGATILRNVRGTDFAARYGGEEFVVLLPGAHEVDTAEVAEVIRDAIANAKWTAGTLRVSIGAVSGVPGIDGDALVRAADRALYEAKRGGRDRTVVGEVRSRPGSTTRPVN